MKIETHDARDYADALKALLPSGAAWDWPEGGLGDQLLLGAGGEMARVDESTQAVLDRAIKAHRPAADSWNIKGYRRVAREALNGLTESMPRRPFTVGAKVGDRVWSHSAPAMTWEVPLVQVEHLLQPLRVGSRVGDRLHETHSRYQIRVYYYRSVVDPKPVFEALEAFKQAHVWLYFVDVTGVGGEVDFGQN